MNTIDPNPQNIFEVRPSLMDDMTIEEQQGEIKIRTGDNPHSSIDGNTDEIIVSGAG
jgi:hypothetical protein